MYIFFTSTVRPYTNHWVMVYRYTYSLCTKFRLGNFTAIYERGIRSWND